MTNNSGTQQEEYIELPPIPRQKWICISILREGRRFDIIYDNGSNGLTKEYWLPQPTDIKVFNITLSDPYEDLIDLVGANWSLTVELKEVLNVGLYDHIRQL
jgi:hypothetical protein